VPECITLWLCLTVVRRDQEADLDAMLAALRDGSYAALVLDAPVLEYISSHNEACDLFLVGEVFETFSLALAFPPAFNDSDVYAFSQSIVKLQVRPASTFGKV
jgi:ABC-type amino acid transport substrate-binding protein